jgi:hypothetical protein
MLSSSANSGAWPPTTASACQAMTALTSARLSVK